MSYLDHASAFGEPPRRIPHKSLRCPVCGRPPHLIGPHPDVMLPIAAKRFGLTVEEMTSHRRCEHLIRARAFYVWAMRSLGAPRSYPKIGRDLGGFDHATMIHLHNRAIFLRLTDVEFAAHCAAQAELFYIAREHIHGNG